MDKYERNIKINRVLTTLDTNNDGVDDTIAYLNQEDLYLPFLLKQSIKDLGVYTDYEEEEEVIDLGGFWNTSNDGFGDGGTNPISDGDTNPYGDGVDSSEVISVDGVDIVYGCTDPTDPNYNSSATVDDGSCLSSQDFDTGITIEDNSTEPSGGGSNQSGGAGCYKLNSGPTSYNWVDYNTTGVGDPQGKAEEWCKAIHPSCGTPYPIQANCQPNGCTNTTTCCPGPPNTYQLLTNTMCDDNEIDCVSPATWGSGCACDASQSLHYGIQYDGDNSTYDTNTQIHNHRWTFYCFQS